jgi:hypothetical protein
MAGAHERVPDRDQFLRSEGRREVEVRLRAGCHPQPSVGGDVTRFEQPAVDDELGALRQRPARSRHDVRLGGCVHSSAEQRRGSGVAECRVRREEHGEEPQPVDAVHRVVQAHDEVVGRTHET